MDTPSAHPLGLKLILYCTNFVNVAGGHSKCQTVIVAVKYFGHLAGNYICRLPHIDRLMLMSSQLLS